MTRKLLRSLPFKPSPGAIIVSILLLSAPALGQVPPQPQIDRAIDRGCAFLQRSIDGYLKDFGWANQGRQSDAVLVLYTLVKGKSDLSHPAFRKVLNYCTNHPIEKNYFASVLAMGLEAHDSKRHYAKIGQCASYLVANQCKNGQWSYGVPVRLPTPSQPRLIIKKGGTTIAKTRVKLAPDVGGPAGDNSNTQYALLGLRSCEEAGLEVPRKTWERALGWWKRTQRGDGGWNYRGGGEGSYLGMTEGGLGSVVLALHYLGRNWRTDDSVNRAKAYIGGAFSLENNWVPRENQRSWQYYHLYALERAGSLAYTETFGAHAWYAEGAKYLLARQGADGRWNAPSGWKRTVWDTCFAILFLARATPPVASQDNSGR